MEKIIERNGIKYKQIKEKCTCSCHKHREGEEIMHFMACCDDEGYNTLEIPLEVNNKSLMTVEQIIHRYGDILTEDEKEELKNYIK